jgi:hypothetical protein
MERQVARSVVACLLLGCGPCDLWRLRNRQLDPKGAGEEPGRNRALGALAQSVDGSCTGADGPVPREKCCFVSPVVVQTRAVCAVLQLAIIREHHSRMVQKRVVQVQQASPLGKPSPY